VDARLHHVQGKTKLVSEEPTSTLGVLTDLYTDKLASLLQHQANARLVEQYDANNTYQYIINREEVQLTWLAIAVADEGGTVPDSAAAPSTVTARVKDAGHAMFEQDARSAQAFLDRWRPRVDSLTNARHRAMLGVILGETREQQRFFEQALAGRTDLLGKRSSVAGPAQGDVLPARWIE
jgi:hypothetical protein